LLCDAAGGGGIVVRLKGGDPMVFGRADEEMGALEAAGIGFEIIPGITTATAAAAALKLSLTKRQVSRGVHFLTGHGADGALPAHDWVALAKAGGTLVVYMGARTMFGAAAHLIEAGMDPALPAVAVENAARPEQRVLRATVATLGGVLEEAAPGGPVLILIGEALRGRGVQRLAGSMSSSRSRKSIALDSGGGDASSTLAIPKSSAKARLTSASSSS
jgi:siroheme synthase